MHLRRIKFLGVVVPAIGLVGFEVFRHYVIQPLTGERNPHFSEHIISGAVLLVGVVGFSFAIFRLLERLHRQLLALNEAAIAVTADLSVDRVLERVAELARTVAGATFASIEVQGQPARTVVSGKAPEGGPTLALPVVVKGERLGELVLSGPRGGRFRPSDRGALEIFATQAGIALENARLFEQVQELVAARERARIGMDLHDGLIQELYAVGLKVEDAAELAAADPSEAAQGMRDVQGVLRGIIGEIRTYVYGLRDGDRSVELRPVLQRVVEEFGAAGPMIVQDLDGDLRLPGATAANVLHIVREALANALRHSAAAQVTVRAVLDGDQLAVSVEDDGVGFDPTAPSPGLGIRDMRERAEWCRCGIDIRTAAGSGTAVRLSVPVDRTAMPEVVG